jgi:hypothetical protein
VNRREDTHNFFDECRAKKVICDEQSAGSNAKGLRKSVAACLQKERDGQEENRGFEDSDGASAA